MKKVSIIYWSNGGNVEVLANAIAESAEKYGAEVTVKHVQDATVEDVTRSRCSSIWKSCQWIIIK